MAGGGQTMPAVVKQVGFCLVCGNPVNSDQEFSSTEEGVCHADCLR